MKHIPRSLLRNAAVIAVCCAALYSAFSTVARLSQKGHSMPSSSRTESPGMRPLEGSMARFFVNKDGLRIHFKVRDAVPEEVEPLGIVVVVHGFGEHSGRYEHVAAALNRAGFVVYLLDHQGHGQSEGDRAHVVHFTDYSDDVRQFVRIVQEKLPQLADRTFIVGHSMGGGVTTLAMQAEQEASVAAGTPMPIRGAVLSAPLLQPDPAVATPLKVALASTLGSMLPKMKLEALPAEFVSRDPMVVRDYVNDPLVYHDAMRIGFASQSLKAMAAMQEFAPNVQWPFLLLHGTDDKLVNIEGARNLFAKAASADKSYKEFEGWYHEIFNEAEGRDMNGVNDALRIAIDWLVERARAAKL